nr:hypothetical protein [Tanacetum cinerariifolium]
MVEPEPQPLLNSPSLDVSLGDVIGPEPPIKPRSPDSSRMKVVDYLTAQTPPSPHVEMFDDDWGLESKEVSPLGEELSLFDRRNEVERGRILEAHRLEHILQQQISQRMTLSHHDAIAITLDLPTMEPEDSLRMRDEHLDTIPKTKWDEFIKSSVENFVPSLSKSEDECECDVPVCNDFTTFSNLLFDVDDDFSSSDNESFSDEDILDEIYSNPLFVEDIISIKIDPHHLSAESYLIESLLNYDSSIVSSSSKIDSLQDEFAGELILHKSIPPGIDEADCDPEEEIRLIEKIVDSYSLMDEIDLSLTPNDSMPPSIEDDDYDSERDILEELLSNYSLSLLENESFHFDILSSPRPYVKPPDDDEIEPSLEILTVKVVDDISEHYVPMPRLLPTQPTLASNQEKSPHLLSHQGLKAF